MFVTRLFNDRIYYNDFKFHQLTGWQENRLTKF